jgi:hypothetical protein
MERSFRDGHSLMHGATMDVRKKPRGELWARAGQTSALGQGRIKRAMTVAHRRRSAATLGNYSRDGAAEKSPAPETRVLQRALVGRVCAPWGF